MKSLASGPFAKKEIDHDSKGKVIGIHWRLGDLLTLEEKKPVELDRILQVLITLIKSDPSIKLVQIASDSPLIASKYISRKFATLPVTLLEGEAIDIVKSLSVCDFFVGSNSKISCWITIARYYQNSNLVSFLPKEVMHHINLESNNISSIISY